MRRKKMMSWTVMSIVILLATGSAHAASSMTNDLTGYTGTSTNAATIAALAVDDLLATDTNTAARAITFDSFGATFPLAGNSDANYIATVDNYGDSSFVAELDILPLADPAYVPFFMGIGTGAAAGEWGVPDLDTSVDSIFVENNGGWYSGVWRQKNGVAEKLTPEDEYNRWLGLYAGHATVTYNAASKTVAFEIARNEDTISYGPFSTEGMFDVDPSRIFFGGKDIVLSNFKVTLPNDTTAPTPDPSFAIGPAAIADNKISMSSTTVVDDLSGVEYNFKNITLSTESGWQSDTNWLDTGLMPSNTYSYTVQARDTSANTNYTAITTNSATTFDEDITAPTPSPMSFTTAPVAVNPNEVFMEATNATDDVTDVEYNFKNITLDTESGWQAENYYSDTGLTPDTLYSYTVTARDTSSNTNETSPSTPVATVTTPDALHWMVNPLTSYTDDSTQLGTWVSLGADSLQVTDTVSADQAIVFDSSGAAFGTVTNGADGRNVLRTTETNYNASSFEAYVTIDFATDQNAVIAMGPAVLAPLDIGYGIPDLNAQGVDGVMGELTSSYAKLLKSVDGVASEILTNVTTAAGTHRLKLVYDAAAGTATVSVDVDYTGVFVEDIDMGTVSTAGLWAGQPVRVSVSGGDGLMCTDLVIKAAPADVVVDDLSIDCPVAGGGVVLSWGGLVGQTYDVQYKTDLVIDPTWTVDTSPGCSDIFVAVGGTMSATSAVNETAVFYQVVPK